MNKLIDLPTLGKLKIWLVTDYSVIHAFHICEQCSIEWITYGFFLPIIRPYCTTPSSCIRPYITTHLTRIWPYITTPLTGIRPSLCNHSFDSYSAINNHTSDSYSTIHYHTLDLYIRKCITTPLTRPVFHTCATLAHKALRGLSIPQLVITKVFHRRQWTENSFAQHCLPN